MNNRSFVTTKYLALLYNYRQNYNQALSFCLISLKINNNQDDLHYLAGEIYDYKSRINDAGVHFKAAVAINNANFMAHIGLARYYSLNGAIAKSQQHFKRAEDINTLKSSPLLVEAQKKRLGRNYKATEALLTQALKSNPAHREIYFELSSTYRNMRKYKEAIETLERLKYYQPHEEMVYAHIANIYYSQRILKKRSNDYRAALYNIEKALLISGDNLRYLELAEELYKLTGNEKMQESTHKKVLNETEKEFNREVGIDDV